MAWPCPLIKVEIQGLNIFNVHTSDCTQHPSSYVVTYPQQLLNTHWLDCHKLVLGSCPIFHGIGQRILLYFGGERFPLESRAKCYAKCVICSSMLAFTVHKICSVKMFSYIYICKIAWWYCSLYGMYFVIALVEKKEAISKSAEPSHAWRQLCGLDPRLGTERL